MTKLVVGSATDVGLVRPINQDQLLVAPGLYAVADGMGGHAAGEVASSTAIAALQAAFDASDEHSMESLESAAKAANRAVWEQARANRGMLGMGTTLVVLAVVERQDGTNGLAVAHIGDSRVYLLRAGSLHQLTVDHSLVQELVDDGQITPAQAAVHPQRHVLTRALGVEPSVEVDILDIDPDDRDRYLLCSDGLPREASDEQITAVLNRFADPTGAAKELVALAKSRGGNDNITVVVVDVDGGDDPTSLIVVPRPTPQSAGRPSASEDATGGGGSPPTALGSGNAAAVGTTAVANQPGLAGLAGLATTTAVPVAGKSQANGRPGPGGAGPAGGGTGTAGPARRSAGTDVLEERPIAAPEGVQPSPASDWPGAQAHPVRAPHPVTWRVVGFVVAVCAVLGGAIACLAWYARSTYYVGLQAGHITVFEGRPGGVLWFQPTVQDRTRYNTASVLSYELPMLRAGELAPSVAAANQDIKQLLIEKAEARLPVPSSARGAPRHARGSVTTLPTTTTAAKSTLPGGPSPSTAAGSTATTK